MKVRIVNRSKHREPVYETDHSAGMDLRANLDGPVTLKPMQRMLIETGIFIEVPVGYEAQVRPRSGLAIRHGITVLNSPGTIDADYRGEVCVIIINLSDRDFVINDGDRIAQMVVAKHEKIEFIVTEKLEKTKRGEGGFGHSGKK